MVRGILGHTCMLLIRAHRREGSKGIAKSHVSVALCPEIPNGAFLRLNPRPDAVKATCFQPQSDPFLWIFKRTSGAVRSERGYEPKICPPS